MTLNIKLSAALLLAASTSIAQASTYNVHAVFFDGGIQGITEFTGSFDYDHSTYAVTNFTGMLSESMFAWRDIVPAGPTGPTANTHWWDPLSNFNVRSQYHNDIYDKDNALGTYQNGDAPLLHLTYDNLVPSTVSGNQVTAMTFLKNNTDVVAFGGYDVWGTDPDSDPNNALAYGMTGTGGTRNNNGFFTLVFDKNDPTNTAGVTDLMVYADETRLGMMGPYMTGWLGMTGHKDFGGGVGSMGGYPQSLTITAVPLPAAAWLFGGAILGMLGVSRRKSNSYA